MFGSDDAKNPKSWYYLNDVTQDGGDMWGIFPRMGFSVMKKKNEKFKSNDEDMDEDQSTTEGGSGI